MTLPVAVICTALDLEYAAVRANVPGPFVRRLRNGTRYETTVLRAASHEWRLALVLAGRENTGAAVQVERAIAMFRPQLLLLVGIAGGRRDCRHGDVIAADLVYDYESGRDADGTFFSRTKSLPAAHSLVQIAHDVVRDGRWPHRLHDRPPVPPPRAFVAPLAAGGKVVTGLDSRTARLIAERCDDARGVETEGYGALHAAYVNKGVDAMVIRGVSDLLGDKHEENDRRWQTVAARHAAAFTFELLDHITPEQAAHAGPTEHGGVMRNDGIHVTGNDNEVNAGIVGNGNTGNTIGAVGRVDGNVTVGRPSAFGARDELSMEILRLLVLLDTYADQITGADEEYDEAVGDLEEAAKGGEVRKGRLKAALRSVLGFTGGVTAVGDAVARVLGLIKTE